MNGLPVDQFTRKARLPIEGDGAVSEISSADVHSSR
jgi:hypothetical protein